MAMETLSSNDFLDFIIYDTISATPPYTCNPTNANANNSLNSLSCSMTAEAETGEGRRSMAAVQGQKKRRRRAKVCKNKEEAENQRRTHINVERNRRKQMNEHLSVLRSLMPHSYVQRGDQASIVGGAIDFVKELEHILQSLEAQKYLQLQETAGGKLDSSTPFAQFFSFPQFSCSDQSHNKHYTSSKSNGAIADIEVTLIETHANIRVLSRRRLRQLSKLIGGFQSVYLSILHLNVTTLEAMVLYSISSKVEEGCQLKSADQIAGAVHQMVRIIEEEEDSLSLPLC